MRAMMFTSGCLGLKGTWIKRHSWIKRSAQISKRLGGAGEVGRSCGIGEKTKLYITTYIALKSVGFDEKIRNRMRYYTIPFP